MYIKLHISLILAGHIHLAQGHFDMVLEPSSGEDTVCMCFSFVFECEFVCICMCVCIYPVFLCLHHGRCECGNVVVVKVQRVGVNQSRFLGAGLSLGASQPEHNWTSHWIQGFVGFLL